MANTRETLERIQQVKNITENIILDKELREQMGPICFPIMKDQLLQNIKDLNDIQFEVQFLHFSSQYPQLFSLDKDEILTVQKKINSLEKHNQMLKNITDVLQYHFTNTPLPNNPFPTLPTVTKQTQLISKNNSDNKKNPSEKKNETI